MINSLFFKASDKINESKTNAILYEIRKSNWLN